MSLLPEEKFVWNYTIDGNKIKKSKLNAKVRQYINNLYQFLSVLYARSYLALVSIYIQRSLNNIALERI